MNQLSTHQADLKGVLEVTISREHQPPDEETVEELRVDLCVELLYTTELLKGPNTLFRILRDFLV